ncbi:MAG: sialate O-acetylesterase [Anaerolineales bacterium]
MKKVLVSLALIGGMLCTSSFFSFTPPRYFFAVMGQSNAGLIYPQLKAALIKRYGPNTRVILSAHGNTAIADFQKGKPLYNSLLAQVLKAKTDGYAFMRLFFYQGEADTRPGLPILWQEQFLELMYNLRVDSNSSPKIYFYRIGACPRTACSDWYLETYYQSQMAKNYPEYVMINTADIPNYPVGIPHHSPAGYGILVRRTMDLIP